MKKQGLSIIECLIFLTIIILILTVVSRLQITTVMVNNTDRSNRNANLQSFAALDIIAKDCYKAHSMYIPTSDNAGLVLLNIPTPEGIIDVGYKIKNNNLRRITGKFNRNTLKWQGAKSTSMLSNVTAFEVVPIDASKGVHIKIIFKANDKEYWLERDIMMRNRVV